MVRSGVSVRPVSESSPAAVGMLELPILFPWILRGSRVKIEFVSLSTSTPTWPCVLTSLMTRLQSGRGGVVQIFVGIRKENGRAYGADDVGNRTLRGAALVQLETQVMSQIEPPPRASAYINFLRNLVRRKQKLAVKLNSVVFLEGALEPRVKLPHQRFDPSHEKATAIRVFWINVDCIRCYGLAMFCRMFGLYL